MLTPSHIRRRPIRTVQDIRLQNALQTLEKTGKEHVRQLEKEFAELTLLAESRGLNRSQGRAKKLVDALR